MAAPQGDSLADLHSTPGVAPARATATAGFKFQQTMLRVKEPSRSLDFYTRVLGMTLMAKLPFPTMKFTLYFLAYTPEGGVPVDPQDRIEACMGREAVLELTHNWGTEDSEWTAHDGNAEPQGFGHIGIEVPNVRAACAYFEKLGVTFKKRPDDGSMKGIAFVKDPDGYWIEVLNARAMRQFHGWQPSQA